jgi:arylsulfatase A-like enzyme
MKILVTVFLCLVCCTTAFPSQKPNVILILADDLGIGGLHCYGNEWLETPNIDRLHEEGMHFSNGLAAYPTCKPSRAALLTGQYGPRTGVYRVKNSYGDENKARLVIPKNGNLSTEKINLAKAFKSAGYTTAMYGKWHVSNDKQKPLTKHHGYDEAFVSSGAHYNAKSAPAVTLPNGMMIGELYTQKAKDFIQRAAEKEKPFFLYMPYFLVHSPFEAEEDLIAHFKKKLQGVELKPKGKKAEVVAAMTKMLDDFVGDLLGKLSELGIEEDTIIVFTSDNGSYDPNLVLNYRGRKGDTYDGGLRVPYIFKWTGKIAAGSRSDERIIGVDVYPTLLSLADIPLDKTHVVDGVDLSAILLGEKNALDERPVYCFYPKYARFNKNKGRWAMSWRNVVYHGDYKLIEYPEYEEYELFNLSKDAEEKENLADKNPEKRDELTKQLHNWLEQIDAPKCESNPDFSL